MGSRNLLKQMERDAWVEPATSSLGKWMAIENKEHCVQGDDFRFTGFSDFRSSLQRQALYGVEMEWKNAGAPAPAERRSGRNFS